LQNIFKNKINNKKNNHNNNNEEKEKEEETIISFSHFVPRIELLPEKNFLLEPLLTRVVGSDFLEKQIRLLKPHLHLFGHTHIPIDLTIENIRYVQWPLGYYKFFIINFFLIYFINFIYNLTKYCLFVVF
jgi:hypothetical protein